MSGPKQTKPTFTKPDPALAAETIKRFNSGSNMALAQANLALKEFKEKFTGKPEAWIVTKHADAYKEPDVPDMVGNLLSALEHGRMPMDKTTRQAWNDSLNIFWKKNDVLNKKLTVEKHPEVLSMVNGYLVPLTASLRTLQTLLNSM